MWIFLQNGGSAKLHMQLICRMPMCPLTAWEVEESLVIVAITWRNAREGRQNASMQLLTLSSIGGAADLLMGAYNLSRNNCAVEGKPRSRTFCRHLQARSGQTSPSSALGTRLQQLRGMHTNSGARYANVRHAWALARWRWRPPVAVRWAAVAAKSCLVRPSFPLLHQLRWPAWEHHVRKTSQARRVQLY